MFLGRVFLVASSSDSVLALKTSTGAALLLVNLHMYRMALVAYLRAFQLRRLAPSLRLGSVPQPFPCKFPFEMALVHVDMHVDCARSQKTCGAVLDLSCVLNIIIFLLLHQHSQYHILVPP